MAELLGDGELVISVDGDRGDWFKPGNGDRGRRGEYGARGMMSGSGGGSEAGTAGLFYVVAGCGENWRVALKC